MNLIINAYFAKSGIPKTGLSPTIRIWEVNETSHILVVSDESMIEIGDGFYKHIYLQTNGYSETKRYVIRCDAQDNTLSNSERYSIASSDEYSLSQETINTITDSVWDESATDHVNTGSTGLLLNQIKADTNQLISDHVLKISLLELLLKYERNKTVLNKNDYTLTIYDNDGTTPLTIFDLKDSTGNPSIVEICQRIPR